MASHIRNRGRLADLARIFSLAWVDPSRIVPERDAFYDARLAINDVGGFLTDLVATRLAVARENQLRLARAEATAGVSQEIRYALTEAALRSFAQNVPPAVMAGLVECGHFSLQDAIAIAMRGSAWERRFDQLSALVSVVPVADLDELIAVARRELRSHRIADVLLAASARLKPEGREDWTAEAIRLIEGEGNALFRCALIRRGADQFERNLLRRLSEGVVHLFETLEQDPGNPAGRTGWLTILCQVLPLDWDAASEGRDPLLETVLELDDRFIESSHEALVTLLGRELPNALRERLVRRAEERFRGDVNGLYRVATLAPPEWRADMLTRAWAAVEAHGIVPTIATLKVAIPAEHRPLFRERFVALASDGEGQPLEPGSDRWWLARAWTDFFRAVPEAAAEQLETALSDADRLAGEEGATLLAGLSQFLAGSQYDKAVTDVASYADAAKPQDRLNLQWALARAAPHPVRIEMYRRALSAAFGLARWPDVVKRLLEEFPREGIPALCTELLASTRGSVKSVIACLLLPHASKEERAQVVLAAFQASEAIDDATQRLDALVAVLRVVHRPDGLAEEERELLADAIASARAIGNPKDQALAFASLFAIRPELEQSLGGEALEAVTRIDDTNSGGVIVEQVRGTALRALAPHLTGQRRAHGSELAEEPQDALWRSWLQTALFKSSSGTRQNMRRAASESRRIPSGLRAAEALIDLASTTTGLKRRLLLEAALTRAREGQKGGFRACCLGVVLGHLDGQRQIDIVAEIRTGLASETSPRARLDALMWLLTGGTPTQRRQAQDEVLELVDAAPPADLVAIFVEVTKRTSLAEAADVVDRLVDALDDLGSAVDQAFYLQDLPAAVATAYRARLYPVLSRLLNAGTTLGREELLGIVTKLLPLCIAVAEPSNSRAIALAVWHALRRWSEHAPRIATSGEDR